MEGYQKAPFSIATREGRYSFPWVAPLYPLFHEELNQGFHRLELLPLGGKTVRGINEDATM